jgi:hypothetical protein
MAPANILDIDREPTPSTHPGIVCPSECSYLNCAGNIGRLFQVPIVTKAVKAQVASCGLEGSTGNLS